MSRTMLSWMLTLLVFPAGAIAESSDWPQFRGPNRDGIAHAPHLLTEWGEDGPPEIWRFPIGASFAAIIVEGENAYTMDSNEQGEFVVRFGTKDGSEIWRTRIAERFQNNFGDGSRATPTLDGEHLYALSGSGKLVALSAAEGTIKFSVDLKQTFGSEQPGFGFSTAPLVRGDRLFVEAGGADGKSIVALNKRTGAVLWQREDAQGAYSSPISLEIGGREQLIFVNKEKVLGITPEGQVLWSHPFAAEQGVKPAMPIFIEPNLIFVSASYDIGAMAVRVVPQKGGEMAVEEVWKNRVMRNHFNSSVALGKHIYGFDNATLKCIDGETGEQLWAQRGRLGKGSLIYAAEHLVVLSETGQLLLVKADPTGYEEVASAKVLSGRCWTSPTLADGRLYLRNREERVAFDLRKPATSEMATR